MAEKLPGGNETILVVDDQETVWDFLIEAVQNLGYSVILAENGLDAVEICRENPGQIDLVILDMIMPKLGGHSTFYQIRELDPNISVLLSSGYVSPTAVNDLLANGAAGFLQKPHRIKTLAEELRRILFDYGEERYAPQIASAICRRRESAPIKTTLELVDIIRSAMPASALREKQHPAKRSFQAIRIAVNDELGAVRKVMDAAIPRLKSGGRLAIITFHSLEDRIVKNAMADASKGCTCPPNFPVCVCGKKPAVKLVNRKPITASEEELENNPRARSAKLRVCEKI